jgi:hypothetical protein
MLVNMFSRRSWSCAVIVGVALWTAGARPLSAQATTSATPVLLPPLPQPPPAQADQSRPPEATNNLDRIRKALSQEPAIKIEDHRLKFYVEIIARWPTFQDYIGKDSDLMNGPVRGSGMTHADFLGIVTPNMYGTSGGIRPVEALQFSIVNWLGQSLARKAIESFRNSRDESDLRRIRQRIEEELASLRGKGGDREEPR